MDVSSAVVRLGTFVYPILKGEEHQIHNGPYSKQANPIDACCDILS